MKPAALSIALATLVLAQAPAARPEFEVASIHPSVQDDKHDSNTDNASYRTHNLTLKRLIAGAYDVDIAQIYGGPNWLDTDSYDIAARIPAEFAQKTRTNVPLMIQNLLADRFHLVIHREQRQVSGLELVIAKKGLKLERAKPEEKGSSIHSNNAHLKATNVTMEDFAKYLSRSRDLGALVVDKTGESGGFNFELDWNPQSNDTPSDHPPLQTALQEQLGLKLESAKIPIQAIVVDRAEKPEAN